MKSIYAALAIIMGDKPDGYYIAGFFFSFLAVLLSQYSHSKNARNASSPCTPRKFSFWFMIGDNIRRIGATMILMFLIFRLFDLSDVRWMIGVGFAVAYGFDKILQLLIEHTDIMNFLQPTHKQVQ